MPNNAPMRSPKPLRTPLAAVAVTLPLVAAMITGSSGVAVGGTRHLPGTLCPVFPGDNYWHADISTLPVNARSAAWTSHMSPARDLHPDFGPSYGAQPVPYGIPVTIVGAAHPKVAVRFQYADESDPVRYPLGADTKIEGGRTAGGDRHAIVVDKNTCRLYETFVDLPTVEGVDRRLRRDVVADGQRAAAARLDVGRRRGSADPAGPACGTPRWRSAATSTTPSGSPPT